MRESILFLKIIVLLEKMGPEGLSNPELLKSSGIFEPLTSSQDLLSFRLA